MTAIPTNGAKFTLSEALAVTGGIAHLVDKARAESWCGVTTDTRSALAGTAFIAIQGERFDGHTFAEQAFEQGAHVTWVERELDAPINQIVVPSTRRALGALAALHRRRWGGRVIAVAGSAGKTSTKSALGALLSALLPEQVHVTPGNLNNDIGVPMVLLGLTAAHRECVLEIGTNQTGEVPYLAALAAPELAVLTLIDLEHTAGLGDIDAIEQEEAAVLHAARVGTFGNWDDVRVRRQLQAASATHTGYGFEVGAGYRVVELAARGATGSRLVVERPGTAALAFESPFVGKPGAYSAVAAIAVAEQVLGRPLLANEVEQALNRKEARVAGRLGLVSLGDELLVVDDTYNANPASVRAAIETASDLTRQRGAQLHLVLGEMRELGLSSEREHRALGQFVRALLGTSLFAVTGDARFVVEEATYGQFVEDAGQVTALLLPRLTGNDVVLVKGSRGVRTERVVEGLRQAKGQSG